MGYLIKISFVSKKKYVKHVYNMPSSKLLTLSNEIEIKSYQFFSLLVSKKHYVDKLFSCL